MHITWDTVPSQVTNGHASAADWTSSFEDYLQRTREKKTIVNPRNKKMTVTSGKSLSENHVVEDLQKKT